MLRYDFRFWDKNEKKMLYGVGISPSQKPVVVNPENGSLEELQGDFVPMINTGQKALNGLIWEADIVECDVPAYFIEGMPASYVKARGVMQFNQRAGTFTLNIVSKQEVSGAEFTVTNSRVIGGVFSKPELLKVNAKPYAQECTEQGNSGQAAA